jgi:hypothetical protein
MPAPGFTEPIGQLVDPQGSEAIEVLGPTIQFRARVSAAAIAIRNLSTAAIARHLHLSTHTVRDYIKAIFEKVTVSSRGELVAKLFAEHFAPLHTHPGGQERVNGSAQ